MACRVHITGASGSGTTTLGRALGERLQWPAFDADDYYWLPRRSLEFVARPDPAPTPANGASG